MKNMTADEIAARIEVLTARIKLAAAERPARRPAKLHRLIAIA